MEEIKLPSGATLKITLSPFAIAKALYQAALTEMRMVGITSNTDMTTIYKEIFCVGFSSPEIEKCLWECFKRCTYNSGKGELRINDQTFEPESAREDYLSVCMEVAKANILPFMKNLYAEYQRILATIPNTPA